MSMRAGWKVPRQVDEKIAFTTSRRSQAPESPVAHRATRSCFQTVPPFPPEWLAPVLPTLLVALRNGIRNGTRERAIVNSCGPPDQGKGLTPSMTCDLEAKVPVLRC